MVARIAAAPPNVLTSTTDTYYLRSVIPAVALLGGMTIAVTQRVAIGIDSGSL
jgi:hypothetical protein